MTETLSSAEFAQHQVVAAVTAGCTTQLNVLVEQRYATEVYAPGLRQAVREGREDLVRLLLPVSDPRDLDSSALRAAVKTGQAALVALLAPVSDPDAGQQPAILVAIARNRADLVQAMAPYSRSNRTLAFAAAHSFKPDGSLASFDVLLPTSSKDARFRALLAALRPDGITLIQRLVAVFDARVLESQVLRVACSLKDQAVIECLLPVSDSQAAWNYMWADRQWAALDALTPHMPLACAQMLLAQAPSETLPHAQARVLAQALPSEQTAVPAQRIRM